MLLTDHILIKLFANFVWCGQALGADALNGFGLDFFLDDVIAQVNAFITDEHRRASNQLARGDFSGAKSFARVFGSVAVRWRWAAAWTSETDAPAASVTG